MALKGIEKVEARFCVQTAVYWGNPQPNGYGRYTFDEPVELVPPTNGVRWERKGHVEFNEKGDIVLSIAQVLVLQDVDELSYLYLGTLDDFESGQDLSNPLTIDGAYVIRRFDKIPMVRKTDEFVRIAWLYDRG
jgi:hypothetical protein